MIINSTSLIYVLRGKPTNHVLYGEDIAILGECLTFNVSCVLSSNKTLPFTTSAGDALLSTSFEHVARETKGVPAERTVEVLRRLGTSVSGMTIYLRLEALLSYTLFSDRLVPMD